MVVGVSLSSAQNLEHSVRGSEPVFVKFSEEGRPQQSNSRSFVASLRERMESLADRLPDLSIAWLGVSCYVRNPLRYKLAPGSTYAHQMGFSAGDWNLSVDGIKPSTLEDLNIALQCPVGERIHLFVRYSDMQYRVDVFACGKLPWE